MTHLLLVPNIILYCRFKNIFLRYLIAKNSLILPHATMPLSFRGIALKVPIYKFNTYLS